VEGAGIIITRHIGKGGSALFVKAVVSLQVGFIAVQVAAHIVENLLPGSGNAPDPNFVNVAIKRIISRQPPPDTYAIR